MPRPAHFVDLRRAIADISECMGRLGSQRPGFPQAGTSGVLSCPQGLTRFGHRLYRRHELMFVRGRVRGRRSL
ncbi:hypothetical protein [Streptomyces europaeiscabiei]|uniref:hypothetical protein n=1 Tax=Streptomyces europaeiscabiei TaxID=146819 RepID=UPI000AB5BE2F|nr:hypothetical protein [Streptomyces europaeiscabiei]MDX3831311.1 hypothetical protein [Streptomyces europaeiscabiei]MDX3862515.1 hypothetical protein [Streptomyces europaeiscabiei]